MGIPSTASADREIGPYRLVRPLDAQGHAVLSDFGVSRIVDDRVRDELAVTMTFVTGATTGTRPVMGTFWYLAPEIRRAVEAILGRF